MEAKGTENVLLDKIKSWFVTEKGKGHLAGFQFDGESLLQLKGNIENFPKSCIYIFYGFYLDKE